MLFSSLVNALKKKIEVVTSSNSADEYERHVGQEGQPLRPNQPTSLCQLRAKRKSKVCIKR